MSSKVFVKNIAKSAAELKAVDIQILDLSKISSFTDYFVVCSGSSDRHVQSIADRIILDQKKDGSDILGVEGLEKGQWVLVDFGSVVVHVFHPEARAFYNIERLWGDAPRVVVKNVTSK